MTPTDGAGPPEHPWKVRVVRTFRPHLLWFLLVNGALTAANVYTGAPWWAFWPLAAWGFALMIHFLAQRALTVDEAWVEDRTFDLRTKSYDMGHIDSIRDKPTQSIQSRIEGEPPKAER